MTTDDRLFEEVFQNELEMEHQEHLSLAILWAYAASRLEAEIAEKIALHVASCGRCAEELRAIREERRALTDGALQLLPNPLERIARPWTARLWEHVQRLGEKLFAPTGFYRHALAYATVGALLLALNFWMNQMPGLLGPEQKEWWALWVVIPWGILVLWHALRVFRR
jgi:anti-sigma factor RsiW